MYSGNNTRYHRFPKNANIRKQWVQACQIKGTTNINVARICSRHFLPEDYLLLKEKLFNYSPVKNKLLNTEAVPSQQLLLETCKSELEMIVSCVLDEGEEPNHEQLLISENAYLKDKVNRLGKEKNDLELENFCKRANKINWNVL